MTRQMAAAGLTGVANRPRRSKTLRQFVSHLEQLFMRAPAHVLMLDV